MSDDPPSRSTRPLNWGIAGTGTIAAHFAADIGHASFAALAGVSSRSADKAEAFATRHGGRAFGSFGAMLEDRSIDAVYIATPNSTHLTMAEAALRAGKAVLVEKPLASASAEAVRIAELAVSQNVFIMEAMWTRFLPAMAHVRDAIASGAIGEVMRIDAELAFHQPYDSASRFFDRAQGGGSLLDLGVYGISLCLGLLGKPDSVSGTWRAAPTGVDMAATVELRFGRARATLASALDRNGANLFVVTGSKASLVLQPPFNAVRMVIEGKPGLFLSLATATGTSASARAARKLARLMPLPGLTRHDFAFVGHGLQFEVDAVADAIAKGQSQHTLAPMADSIETLRIIERVLASPAS